MGVLCMACWDTPSTRLRCRDDGVGETGLDCREDDHGRATPLRRDGPAVRWVPGVSTIDLQASLAAEHVQAWRWALLCAGRQQQLAQDALQNSYLAILDGKARFAGDSSFRTFLFAVIRRQVQRLQRRNWLDQWWPQRLHAQLPEPVGIGNERLQDSLDAARLWSALQSLPQRQREVLALVFGHELPITEAAAVLDLRLGTARTHYARGKAALRARLGLQMEVQ